MALTSMPLCVKKSASSDGDDRVAQDLRNLFVGDEHAPLGRELADERAVAAEHARDRAGRVVVELRDLRAGRRRTRTARRWRCRRSRRPGRARRCRSGETIVASAASVGGHDVQFTCLRPRRRRRRRRAPCPGSALRRRRDCAAAGAAADRRRRGRCGCGAGGSPTARGAAGGPAVPTAPAAIDGGGYAGGRAAPVAARRLDADRRRRPRLRTRRRRRRWRCRRRGRH